MENRARLHKSSKRDNLSAIITPRFSLNVFPCSVPPYPAITKLIERYYLLTFIVKRDTYLTLDWLTVL